MIEVEIKVKISNPDEIRKKFQDHKGLYKISLLHEDTYYNMPKGLRDFKETDEALRIRKSIGYNKFNPDLDKVSKDYITYKGRKLDEETKTRKELDIQVEDGEKLQQILDALEFQKIFTVEKERELHEFEFKGLKIETLIDYIPILNEYFIEVEHIVESSDKLDSVKSILFEFLNQFGIKNEDSIRKSYLELIADRFKSKRSKKSD